MKNGYLSFVMMHRFFTLFLVAVFTLPVAYNQSDSVEFLQEEYDTSAYYDTDEEDAYVPPTFQLEPVEQRSFDREKWEKERAGMEFSEDLKTEKKKEEKPKEETRFSPEFLTGLKYFFIIAGTALLIFIIAKLLDSESLFAKKDSKIKASILQYAVDEAEQNLLKTDLNEFIRQALNEKNYTLAVRLYYLEAIKKLTEKGALQWKRDKTNRDYLRELGAHSVKPKFREATLIFERVWYGDGDLKEGDFNALQPKFLNLLQQISTFPTPVTAS